MALNKLTNIEIHNAKPKGDGKARKLSDGGGLYLEVAQTGSKGWRFRYRFEGKEKLISFGSFEFVTMIEARKHRDDARKLLHEGVDPSEKRKKDKQDNNKSIDNTFEVVGDSWFESEKHNWGENHQEKVRGMLRRNLYRWIGQRPIRDLAGEPAKLLEILKNIEKQGKVETARRAKQVAGQVFRHGMILGHCDADPTQALQGRFKASKTKHRAAIIDPKEAGRLMLAIEGYQGTAEVSSALKLAPLVFVRPGELRHAEWSEIDWDKEQWVIPAEKMKMREGHIVPLSRQAMDVLRSVRIFTGDRRYVLPSARTIERPMSDNAVLTALRTMGYPKEKMSGHGFRALARTLLDEKLGYRVEWIEMQLAHNVREAHGRAYNRTAFLDGRREMMQGWADYLDELKEQARLS